MNNFFVLLSCFLKVRISERGASLVELVITLPVLLMVAFGTLEANSIIFAGEGIHSLTRELASVAYRECGKEEDFSLCMDTLQMDLTPWDADLFRKTRFPELSAQLAPGAEYIVSLYQLEIVTNEDGSTEEVVHAYVRVASPPLTADPAFVPIDDLLTGEDNEPLPETVLTANGYVSQFDISRVQADYLDLLRDNEILVMSEVFHKRKKFGGLRLFDIKKEIYEVAIF